MSLNGYQAVRRVIEGNVSHGNVIYTDAYELAVQYGFKGSVEDWLATIKGEPGYTPQKGVDYWTPDEISIIQSYIDEAVAKAIGGGTDNRTAVLAKALLGTMVLGKGE